MLDLSSWTSFAFGDYHVRMLEGFGTPHEDKTRCRHYATGRAARDELAAKVAEWVERDDWVTKTYAKKMRDSDGTLFEVPSLVIQKGPTRLLLDPVAYDAPGSEGEPVDLYLMPTYDDAASLYLVNGRWRIQYVSPDQPAAPRSRNCRSYGVVRGNHQAAPRRDLCSCRSICLNGRSEVKAVENEYKSVRIAVDQLMVTVARDPTVLRSDARPQNLGVADKKLAGTI